MLNRRILKGIFGIAVIVVAIGLFAKATEPEEQAVKGQVEEVVTKSSESPVSPLVEEYENRPWETYTNEEYGFKMQYPFWVASVYIPNGSSDNETPGATDIVVGGVALKFRESIDGITSYESTVLGEVENNGKRWGTFIDESEAVTINGLNGLSQQYRVDYIDENGNYEGNDQSGRGWRYVLDLNDGRVVIMQANIDGSEHVTHEIVRTFELI